VGGEQCYSVGWHRVVSISSTSEEVQSFFVILSLLAGFKFPLVQLPKKFKEGDAKFDLASNYGFH